MINITELLELKKINRSVQGLVIDDVELQIMALTSDLIAELKLESCYADVVALAANMGVAFNGVRVYSDTEQLDDLCDIWINELPQTEPTIQHQVGEKVCEISGLDDFLQELLESEEALENEEEESTIVDGDDLNLTAIEIAANRAIANNQG